MKLSQVPFGVLCILVAMMAHGAAAGACDRCNIPIWMGGCKCNGVCGCVVDKCTKCNIPAPGGCKCNGACDCLDKCAKCNIPVENGGCKCNGSCDCIGPNPGPNPGPGPVPPPSPVPPGTGRSFGGANSYFLHLMRDGDRIQILDAMRAANFKVIRIFISIFGAEEKGGAGNQGVPDVENPVGTYNNQQLQLIDRLMLEASQRGMKLIVTLHDRYSLGCWHTDAYQAKYNIPRVNGCSPPQNNDARDFYRNPSAAVDMDRRFRFIINHVNPLMGNKPWRELTDAVFAFDIQNESQGHLANGEIPNRNWICDRAKNLRGLVNRGILIGTGGGTDIDDSIIQEHFRCPALDLIGVHSYNPGAWASRLQGIVATAKQFKKRIIVEEFGSDKDKAAGLNNQIAAMQAAGVPWVVWEVIKPNDFNGLETFTEDQASWRVLSDNARRSLSINGAFAWPELKL